MDLQPAAQPTLTLETERLILRAPHEDDAARIAEIANDLHVIRGTLRMPLPYTPNDALEFIALAREGRKQGETLNFSIERRAGRLLIGGIGLVFQPAHERAEMGYWLGVDYWNQGYATEAGRTLLEFGFDVLGLYRIYATHFADNAASGRVMQKLGMTYEGTLRGHLVRFDQHHDSVYYGILRSEWEAARSG